MKSKINQINTRFKFRRGFTIVETLVAITVLMISIIGPLTVANKGLVAAINAKDQMIASYLAQDAMEFVKNVKYYNISNSNTWNNGFASCSITTPCLVNSIISVGPTQAGIDPIDNLKCSSGSPTFCPVLFSDIAGYVQDKTKYTDAAQTLFSRRFYLSDCSGNQCALHVDVAWNEGTIPYQISLVSYISDKTY